MARGSVIPRSIKVLFLGATRAGKTALVAALRGEELPAEEDRSLATRMHKLRMTFDKGKGKFETVPFDESRLAGAMSGETEEEEEEEEEEREEYEEEATDEEEEQFDMDQPILWPSAFSMRQSVEDGFNIISDLVLSSSSLSPASSSPISDATTDATTCMNKKEAMEYVRSLFETNAPRTGFVDMDTFDFAG